MEPPARVAGYRAIVRGAHVKWWIFGVALPLLPICARVAAAWLDGADSLGFVDLFGDGELLVLATVIAAAGIGDLVFDVHGDRRRGGPERLRIAFVHALALIVVVGSVLFFGLVTYANQTRADALKRAQSDQVVRQVVASTALTDAKRLAAHAAALDAERRQLERRLHRLYEAFRNEVSGQGGSRTAGYGVVAHHLQAEANALRKESARLRIEARQLHARSALQSTAATRRLTTSNANVDRGREQAAEISVIMFLLSLAAAFPVVGLIARNAAEAGAGV